MKITDSRILIGTTWISLILMFVFASCSNTEDENVDPESVLEETAFTENVFTELKSDVDDAVDLSEMSNGRYGKGFGRGACATRTVEEPEDGGYPKVITIEYGEDCDNGYGMEKSGKIIITITDSMSVVGAQVIETFEEFYVNGNLIEGTRTRTIVSETVYTCTLEGGKITTEDGDVITRESTRTYTQTSGADTDDRSDDVFEITGSASGVSAEGVSYSKTITEALVKSNDCPWIISGIIETVVDGETSTLDFGDGECDNTATLTTADGTEEITMNYRINKRSRRHKGDND